VIVLRVVGDQLRESVGVRTRRCDSLEDEADSGFPEVEASLVFVVRVVGHVLTVEIRNVVVLELDEPTPLDLVEGADHAGAAEISSARPLRLIFVFGVQRPAVVESRLGLGDDFADRRLDPGTVPGLVEDRLVALGIEERQR
jgi:hypothetical protein